MPVGRFPKAPQGEDRQVDRGSFVFCEEVHGALYFAASRFGATLLNIRTSKTKPGSVVSPPECALHSHEKPSALTRQIHCSTAAALDLRLEPAPPVRR